MQSEKKWYQFWKRDRVYEENAVVKAEDHTHEFNTSIGSAYINMLCGSSESPYTIQEIRAFTKNPMIHITELRKVGLPNEWRCVWRNRLYEVNAHIRWCYCF